jgi:hypothetical protein
MVSTIQSDIIRQNFYFTIAQQPLVVQDLLIIGDSWSHSVRHTELGRTSLHKWSARRKDLCLTPYNTQKRKHPCLRRDSNPKSQQAIGRKSTPLTLRPLGLVRIGCRSSSAEFCLCEGSFYTSYRNVAGWNTQKRYWIFCLLSFKPSSDSVGKASTLLWIRLTFTI